MPRMFDDTQDPFSFDMASTATPSATATTPRPRPRPRPSFAAPTGMASTVPPQTAIGGTSNGMPSFSYDQQTPGEPGAELPGAGPLQPGADDPSNGHEPGGFTGQQPRPRGPQRQPRAPHVQIMQQLRQTTDPQQKAVLQDQLGRSLFSSLKTAGHDVKWQGDNLVVDGRSYVLGDGQGIAPGEDTPNQGPAPMVDQARPSAGTLSYGRAPSGYDQGKWDDPNSDSAKYITSRFVQQIGDQARAIPDQAGREAFFREQVQTTLAPMLSAQGWTIHDIDGDRLLVSGHGYEPGWVDAVGDVEGGFNPAWTPDDAGAPAGAGRPPMTRPPLLDGPTPGGAGAPRAADPAAGGPAAPGGWRPGQGPRYTPGAIGMDDIPGFSYEDLLRDMGMRDIGSLDEDYEAGTVSNDPLDAYDFGGFGDLGELGAGRTDAETEALISRLLANPESLDPRTIAMLKARNKDGLAEMQLQDDEDLVEHGFLTGNADSNWLASERLAAKGRRDKALLEGDRDVDIEAARTNQEDRRAAAGLGMSYADSRSGRNRADRAQRLNEATAGEGFRQDSVSSRNRASVFRREGETLNEQLRGDAFDRRQTARQGNIDNQFRSAAEKRAAVALASDQSLKAAALRGDRMALRETLAQRATELGISQDQVMSSYLLGLMDDATRRHGIDTGASIDRARIDQQSQEWKEELAYKLAALAQADRQFGASYGLDLGRYRRDLDNDSYNRYLDTMSYEG